MELSWERCASVPYTEGPLAVPEGVAFTSYSNNAVLVWKSDLVHEAWTKPGSGPTALARDSLGTWWVCAYDSNHLIQIKPSGELIESYSTAPFSGPNDIVAEGEHLWYTTSGRFARGAAATGAVHHLFNGKRVTIATNMNYANGIALAANGEIAVAEHFANRIVWLTRQGEVTRFTPLPTVTHDEGGPDGLAFDASGNLWVAHHREGRVIRISPQFEIASYPTPIASPTNVTFDLNGTLWLTGFDTDEATTGGLFRATNAA